MRHTLDTQGVEAVKTLSKQPNVNLTINMEAYEGQEGQTIEMQRRKEIQDCGAPVLRIVHDEETMTAEGVAARIIQTELEAGGYTVESAGREGTTLRARLSSDNVAYITQLTERYGIPVEVVLRADEAHTQEQSRGHTPRSDGARCRRMQRITGSHSAGSLAPCDSQPKRIEASGG